MQIFDLFDVKRRGVVDFDDFVKVLNVFHPNASKEAKINCKSLSYIRHLGIVYVHPKILSCISNDKHFILLLQSHLGFMTWMAQGLLSAKRYSIFASHITLCSDKL